MWYFSWILGVSLACAFGIINTLWLEAAEDPADDTDGPGRSTINQ